MRPTRTTVAILSVICAAATYAADWAMLRGNRYLTGCNDGIVPSAFSLAWKHGAGGRLVHVVAGDGLVIATTLDKRMLCLDLESGEKRWEVETGAPVIRMPVVSGTRVLFAAGTRMVCLDKWTGNVAWARSYGRVSQLAAPIVENGTVFYGNREAFFARRVADGALVWQNNGVWAWGAAAVFAEGAILTQHRDYRAVRTFLACMDAATGKTRWTQPLPQDANIYAALVYGDTVYAGSAQALKTFRLADGAPGRSYTSQGRLGSNPFQHGGLVYVSDDAGQLIALDPATLAEKHRLSNRRAQGNTAAAAGPWLYLTDEAGRLWETDATTGRERRRWESGSVKTPGYPVLSGGRVLFVLEDTLYCVGAPGTTTPRTDDPGTLNLLLVDAVTKEPVRGQVRLVWRRAGEWNSWSGSTENGEVSLSTNRLFPSELSVEKRGYLPASRSLAAKDAVGVLRIELVPVTVGASLVLRNVHFDTDSWGLLPDSPPVLDRVTQFLKDHPGLEVEIGGHTDATGIAAENLLLSRRRAEVVREYLVRHGVPAGRLAARGYGAGRPVADNTSEDGRRLNRRTEFRVTAYRP